MGRSIRFASALFALAITLRVTVGAEDWPEWRGAGRLGVWNTSGIVETFPPEGLPVAWRTPIMQGYAGPAIAAGRVFVTDARPLKRNEMMERISALDEKTGKVLWSHEWQTDYTGMQLVYAIGPRATPTVDGDRVFALGAMGNLFALDTATGKVLWAKDYVKDFNASVPSWGMTGAPLVDGDRLICLVGGEPDAMVMALDKATGKEIWRSLTTVSEPGYNQPIIIEHAGVRQLIIWLPQNINGLDPATGKPLWKVDHAVEMGLTIPTPVKSGPYLFFTSQYGGARMLKLDDARPGATILWSGAGESDRDYPSPNSLDSVISTPVIQGDYVYGLDGMGMLRCLELTTGKQVWEVRDLLKERAKYGTAFFVRVGDRYFINNDRGELVIAKLSPRGFEEISRTKLIEPTHPYVRRREMPNVLWSHAAYANQHVVVRNDREIVRFSLAKP